MKKKTIVLISILISFFIHLFFLMTSYYYWVPGAATNFSHTQKMFRVTPPKPVALPEPEIEQTAKEKIAFQKPTDELKKIVKENAVKKATVDSDLEITPEEQAQEIQEKKIDQLPQAQSEVQKEKAAVNKREAVKESLKVDQAILRDSAEISLQEEGVLHIPIEFEDKMHAFTPEIMTNGIAEQENSDDQINWQRYATASPHFQPTTGYEKLDAFLNTQLRIYQDPSDGLNYYELSIYPNAQADGGLPVLQKEVSFLIDASSSIEDYRLHAFKEGIKEALTLLNSGDLFNLYVFQQKIISFSDRSLPANPMTLSQAGYFLDRLTPQGRTNIYSAFLQTLEKRETIHPSYIILLSDGRANAGVDSTAKLIAKITAENSGTRPIFAFSGGARVNRFLLDFLAYPNRGWAEHTQNKSEIQGRFENLNLKIKNPVLTEVKYQFSGVPEGEVFPKNLPDFYRDAVFTLYGRYETIDDLFSIRITGKNNNKNKEFIYSNHLKKAQKGSRDIAKAWAFNKVYFLISQMTLKGASEDSKREIRNLLNRFDLKIPYEFEGLVS
jgi:uncharacterized protein YegL